MRNGKDTKEKGLVKMKSKKARLSFEQHQKIGQEFKILLERLLRLGGQIPPKYGRRMRRAFDSIDLVRCKLEDEMIRENPDLSNRTLLNVYYGGLAPVLSIAMQVVRPKTRKSESTPTYDEPCDVEHPTARDVLGADPGSSGRATQAGECTET
jgi:hypothetical protein